MFALKLNHAVLGLASLGLLSGCVVTESNYDRDPDYHHGHEVVVEEPTYVVVRSDVPAPRPDVIVARPGPSYVWVGGYYAPQGHAWVWVPGNWMLPPRPGAVWVAPRYERHSAAEVRFTGGRWDVSAAVIAPAPAVVAVPPVVVVAPQPAVAPAPVVLAPDVIVVHTSPPRVIVEKVPPSPGRGYFWIKGYYVADRSGGWHWMAGHYERPPHAGAVWVEPRYEQHGPDIHFSLGFWQ